MAVQEPREDREPVGRSRPTIDAGRVAPTLDRSAIAAFREIGSPAFIAGVIDQYVAEVGGAIDAIRDAAERQDTRALKALAHSLKGSSMTVGAQQLAALCAALEGFSEGAPCPSRLLAALDEELVLVRAALAHERLDVLEPTSDGAAATSSGSGR